MYKVGFLKCSNQFDQFLDGFNANADRFDYSVTSYNFDLEDAFDIDFNEFDIFFVTVDLINYADLEIYITNLRYCFNGVLIVLDVEFNKRRKFILNQLGVDLYFFLPIKEFSFVRFFPWMLRNSGKSRNIIYEDICLDLDTRSLVRGKKKYFLKNMEFRLMEYLMKNNSKILSKIQIMEDVWDMNAFTNSKTLEVHICKLRQKIDRDFDRKLLHTIPNTGYMLK